MRILLLALLLCGCASRVVVQDRPTVATVAVTVPCVSGARPDAVAPLSAQYGPQEWAGMTPKQKAALAAAQGLRHKNRAEALDAATGACQ